MLESVAAPAGVVEVGDVGLEGAVGVLGFDGLDGSDGVVGSEGLVGVDGVDGDDGEDDCAGEEDDDTSWAPPAHPVMAVAQTATTNQNKVLMSRGKPFSEAEEDRPAFRKNSRTGIMDITPWRVPRIDLRYLLRMMS